MLHPDYPIQTERLILRPLSPDDVDALFAYQSREDVCRYIPYAPRTRERVLERITAPHGRSFLDQPGDALSVAVQLRSSGELVGDVVLFWHSEEHRSGEIGYVFSPDHTGHGYATETAHALLRLGFAGLGLHRIVARVDARNTASAAVARRIDMRQEAHLVQNEWFKGEWSDELVFAILQDEWRAAQVS
ncbi:MAG: GNAT family protein [Jatrophihabitantaceae bacterium]